MKKTEHYLKEQCLSTKWLLYQKAIASDVQIGCIEIRLFTFVLFEAKPRVKRGDHFEG